MAKWDTALGTYISGESEITEVDLTALSCERRWGTGRLRLLVDPALRAKFDAQRLKLDEAIRSGELADVQREARRMVTAWKTLDRAATEAGKDATPPACWEVPLSDGTVLAIVRDEEAASLVQTEGRQVAVWTLAEIARVIEARARPLQDAKVFFPGAEVTVVRRRPDPVETLNKDELK